MGCSDGASHKEDLPMCMLQKQKPGGLLVLPSVRVALKFRCFEVTVCDLKDAIFWLLYRGIFLRLSTFRSASGLTVAALAIASSGKTSSGR